MSVLNVFTIQIAYVTGYNIAVTVVSAGINENLLSNR